MAHFAELDGNNAVTSVIAVANAVLRDAPFPQSEATGISFLTELYGHSNWRQTSYSGSFRKNYAGKGYTFDVARDAFIPPKPFQSWVLNEGTCQWEAPILMPNDGSMYGWNEAELSWVAQNPS